MRKPNAILHMTLWGLFGGAVLGILYGISLMSFFAIADSSTTSPIDFLRGIIGIAGFGAFYGALFGGIPGVILGFIDGLVLWYMLRKIEIPISMPELIAHQKRAQWANAIVTLVGVYLVAIIFLGGLTNILIVGIPSLIAGFAAFVVTRRYFMRLANYAEKGKRKVKEA